MDGRSKEESGEGTRAVKQEPIVKRHPELVRRGRFVTIKFVTKEGLGGVRA